MSFFLLLSRIIDKINDKVGLGVSWALLIAVIICSGNALIRYTFNSSSNAWLEIQWYLFSAIFLLATSHTLHRNEHIRIDVISSRLPKRAQVWIDIFGFTVFLLPISLIILYYAVPYAWESFQSQEYSSNAGGLIVWPAKLLIPVGFLMLTLQAFSELIKRIGYLMGKVDASEFERHARTPEEAIEAIKAANKIN